MDLSAAGYAEIASFVLNLLVLVVGGTWGIAKVNDKLQETFQGQLEDHKASTSAALEASRHLTSTMKLDMERKVGEVGTAIREKITQVELYTRDHFVRRETFQEVVKLMSSNMETQFANIQASLNRLSDKLDRINERQP